MCYAGNILRIDLSKEEGKRQKVGESFVLKYLGGDGFGAYFMNKEMDAKVDVFSPENLLIVSPAFLLALLFRQLEKHAFSPNQL